MKNKAKLKIPGRIWFFFHKRNVGDVGFMLTIMQGYYHKLSGNNIKLNQQQINDLTEDIYSHFDSFKEYAIMRIKKRRKSSNSYNDWFNKCNTNGDFVYNGVTEDF